MNPQLKIAIEALERIANSDQGYTHSSWYIGVSNEALSQIKSMDERVAEGKTKEETAFEHYKKLYEYLLCRCEAAEDVIFRYECDYLPPANTERDNWRHWYDKSPKDFNPFISDFKESVGYAQSRIAQLEAGVIEAQNERNTAQDQIIQLDDRINELEAELEKEKERNIGNIFTNPYAD